MGGIATDFEVSIDEHADDYSVVAVRGEMDLHTSPKVQGAIERASENNGVDAVVVDMSGVAFMDSTALSALVRSKDALGKRDIALRLASHADTYVLVSGDGDYVEAIEYLQSEKGLRVEVISAAQCTSQALLDTCDSHTDLADIPDLFRRSGPSKQIS